MGHQKIDDTSRGQGGGRVEMFSVSVEIAEPQVFEGTHFQMAFRFSKMD